MLSHIQVHNLMWKVVAITPHNDALEYDYRADSDGDYIEIELYTGFLDKPK